MWQMLQPLTVTSIEIKAKLEIVFESNQKLHSDFKNLKQEKVNSVWLQKKYAITLNINTPCTDNKMNTKAALESQSSID